MKSNKRSTQARERVLPNPLIMLALGLLISLMVLAAATLTGAQITVSTDDQIDTPPQVAPVKDDADDEEEMDTVTMEIPLEKGGTVDLKLHSKDVKIGKYDGEKVLLIIESPKPNGLNKKASKGAMDIEIKRNGNDVQIKSKMGPGADQLPENVSFTILVPSQEQIESPAPTHERVIHKLLTVMQKRLRRDTMNWLM